MSTAYIFPGQGAQYVGMGKDLYDKFERARHIFETANKILGFDIAKLCFEGPKEELIKTEVSQPAILTTSIAALEALKENRMRSQASAAAGLSLGEYSALVAAESISFEDAVLLVRRRGEFMEEASRANPGKMASIIGLDKAAVEEICKDSNVEIANLNCPGQIVISGKVADIDRAMTLAKEKGAKRCIVLDVSGPFHSSLMADAGRKLSAVLDKIKISAPKIPVVANVSADCPKSPDDIKRSLVEQVAHTTRWHDSILQMKKLGINTFLEIGPGDTLKGLLRRIDAGLAVYNICKEQDIAAFLSSLN